MVDEMLPVISYNNTMFSLVSLVFIITIIITNKFLILRIIYNLGWLGGISFSPTFTLTYLN